MIFFLGGTTGEKTTYKSLDLSDFDRMVRKWKRGWRSSTIITTGKPWSELVAFQWLLEKRIGQIQLTEEFDKEEGRFKNEALNERHNIFRRQTGIDSLRIIDKAVSTKSVIFRPGMSVSYNEIPYHIPCIVLMRTSIELGSGSDAECLWNSAKRVKGCFTLNSDPFVLKAAAIYDSFKSNIVN